VDRFDFAMLVEKQDGLFVMKPVVARESGEEI
jgi:hypothetical protein